MPSVLPNTTTTDNYQDTHLGGSSLYGRGILVVANNPVSLRVTTAPEVGAERVTEYPFITPTVMPLLSGSYVAPGAKGDTGGFLERIVGVEIKSAVSGQPAQVSGWLIEPQLAGPDVGQPFNAAVSASGGVTPGLQSVQIQKNAVLVGTEPAINFVDGGGQIWTATDVPASTRVDIRLTGGASVGAGFANPGFITAAAARMMGFGAAGWVLTPTRSGIVFVFAQGRSDAAGGAPTFTIYGGTGAAPANNTAAPGGSFAATIPVTAGLTSPLSLGIALTLVVGTAYWFDIGVVSDGVNIARFTTPTLSVVEL